MTAALDIQQSVVEIEPALSKNFPYPSMCVGVSVIDAVVQGRVT